MKKIINIKETISVQGLTISDFLDKNFLDKIKQLGKKVDPISLILMIKDEEGEKGDMHPVILGHNSNKEIDEKILNLNAPKELSEKIIKLLEDMEERK